ncbi:MAG: hypothetical protein HYU84_11270 [Chloroflexi bacterium]|nr:hypothetical protein [Chloroflexota bacterium]MBI3170879.1 hypothetical protein [Chloroflexota bacterium]
MRKIIRLFHLFIVCALFLSACNLPSNDPEGAGAAATFAAQTVEALLNASPTATTANSVPPTLTFTPFPTNTTTPAATATPTCPQAQFVTDVTIPDGTVMTPGQSFTKKWRIRNTGQCAWNGYNLVFDSGDAMSGPASQAIGVVSPGQEIDLEVSLTAPNSAGNYRGYWRIVSNSNVLVPILNGYQGRAFYVDIKVQAPNVPTATNTSAPAAFAVTSVTFSTTGGCGSFTATANITVNGPGTVNWHWIRNDGGVPPVPSPMVFAAAGTQSSSISWATTASGSHSFDVYIDSPNHQQFGSASFTCP